MKPIKKIISSLTTATLLMIGLALSFNACTQQSPMSSDNEIAVGKKELKILKLGDSSKLFKKTEVSEWITVKGGGILYLGHEGDNGLAAKISLEILPGAISQDAEVKISLDDQDFKGNLDVVFSPHGTTFSQPALLTIFAVGLDFSGVDPDEVNIYYDNPETGEWEQMESDYFKIDPTVGALKVVNAKLPHFSRYAIGAE